MIRWRNHFRAERGGRNPAPCIWREAASAAPDEPVTESSSSPSPSSTRISDPSGAAPRSSISASGSCRCFWIARDLDVDDRAHVLLPQPVEEDDLVQPVQELGPEMRPHHLHHLRLGLLYGLVVAQRCDELR